MSVLPSCKRCLGLLAALFVTLATAWAGDESGKIQFSDPSQSNLTDNAAVDLNKLNPTPGAFRQAQEGLLAPVVKALQPRNSMQTIMPRPQNQSSLPSEQTRRLMDQRKNWAFQDFNDLNSDSSTNQEFGNLPFGKMGADDKSSVIDKYYQRLSHQSAARAKTGSDSFDPSEEYADHEGAEAGLGRFSGDNDLMRVLAARAKAKSAKNTKSAFGSGGFFQRSTPMENPLAEEKRRQDFMRLLDPNLPSAQVKSSLSPIGFDQFATAPATDADALKPAHTDAQHSALYHLPTLADPNAALHSSVYDNPTAAALGLPNPLPTKVTPHPMTGERMQDMMDPFAAVAKKRVF